MVGKAIVGPDGTFQMDGVEPGTYIAEVYPMEMDLQNPDFNQLMNMDYTPAYSQEVVVGEGPMQLNISLGGPANE
jgi:hypothetical protein